jgi:two-component system sensor histidine kinase BarA
VVIAASFYFFNWVTKNNYERYRARLEKQVTARGAVDPIILSYHWFKFYEKQDEEKRFINFMTQALPNQESPWEFIWTRRNGPSDSVLEPEMRIVEKFRHTPDAGSIENGLPEFEDFQSGEHPTLSQDTKYVYYQALRATKSCILCHRALGTQNVALGDTLGVDATPLEEGDLLGVVKVVIADKEVPDASLSNPELRKTADINTAILWTFGICTVSLAVIASYLIIRYIIVKPLKHLRDVSDEISHGNINLRADIHTGDEFEELGNAFNRMLRHLVDAQEKMRGVNADLDAKVDELAQVNMQLYEMNRLKSDFLATMSHELRTPLNSIIGFSDVLESIAALDDKQKRYVQNIQKSGRVLLDMINDILDLAKIESGKMEVRPSDFRIDNVISAQCDMARPLTERKNIDLDMEVAPDLPELYQDQGKVQQILNNLLSNAIKFTPEGGRIVVSATRNDHGELLLTVADTGVGIAEEDQTAIFEKFRQGRTALSGGDAMTREYSGTGLGLSIVKELCKLLGGSIALESQLGRGSAFMVRLPWTRRASQPKLDTTTTDTARDDLLRPRRADLRRPQDQPVAADFDI